MAFGNLSMRCISGRVMCPEYDNRSDWMSKRNKVVLVDYDDDLFSPIGFESEELANLMLPLCVRTFRSRIAQVAGIHLPRV